MSEFEKRTCIIIPAFNEEKNISKLIKEISALYPSAEVIIVDDGSTDKTRDVVKRLGVKVIALSSNLGIGGAVQTGLLYAIEKGYDLIFRMDGDGQHDSRYIREMYDHIVNDKMDIVIGSRYIDKKGFQSTYMRRMGGVLISCLLYFLCKKKIKDPTSGYWGMNKEAAQLFVVHFQQDYPEPEAIITAIDHGLNVGEIPVVMRSRNYGKSTIDFRRSLYFMIKVSLSLLFYKFESRGEI